MRYSVVLRSTAILCVFAALGSFPFPASAQSLGPTGNSRDVRYGYDAQGMRAFEEERTPFGTTVTHSPTSAYREIFHPDGTVERIVSIEVAGIPVATIRTVGTSTPEVFATHADHLRSTRLVTTEGAGLGNVNIVEQTDYDPFGKITKHEQAGDFQERKKYTSHEFDSATNYTYAKARYLNTEDGRFISQDPGSRDDPEKYLTDPQQLNSYAYARNNPIKYVDPTGESATLIGTLAGAGIGAGVAFYQGRSWGEVAHSAFTGAVAGAIAGSIIDTGGATLGLVAASTVGGGAGTLGATVAGNAILGQGISAEEVTRAAAGGLLFGFVGGVAGEYAGVIGGGKGGSIGVSTGKNADFQLQQMIRAGGENDRGGLTKAGRSLQKHGDRTGSAFPAAKGNPNAINAQGKVMLEKILSNPNVETLMKQHGRFGNIMDIQIPGGPGVRFSADGQKFIHFLEP